MARKRAAWPRWTLGLGALVVAACGSSHYIDLNDFCARRPDDVECVGRAGQGGVSGLGGTSGVSGSPMGSAGIGGAGSGSGGGGAGSGGTGGVACTAPKTDCGGTCAELATDPAHCGVCGRSCLGTATCAAGACVPEAMTDVADGKGEVAPYAMVDDGTSLYWVSPTVLAKGSVNDARMRRVLKTSVGGLATNVFDSTRVRARSLGFDGTKLYWGDLGANPSDTNQRLASGLVGSADATTVEADQLNVQHVALAGTKVYWAVANDAAVRGKLADGTGNVEPEVVLQSNPRWVVVDTDAAAVPYWVANAAGGQREVRRLVPPSSAEAVASGPDVVAVELTPERFYWADRGAQTVQSRPKATPTETPRDEFGGQGPVEGFRLEGATLYVLTAQGRQLKAWRKGPGDDAPLLLGEVEAKADPYGGNPFGAAYVLTDASYVYFADVGTFLAPTPDLVQVSVGNGVVYRVAK